jgi:pyridinium-3,5-biscarboxylic acid mononucleotide sulfurtransferase
MIQHEKYRNLIGYLKNLENVVVAFSGGVDSSFVLAACKEALGENVVAITMNSYSMPEWDLEDSKKIALFLNAKHIIIDDFTIEDSIRLNPVNRCYFCKKEEFGTIIKKAKELGVKYVLDGTNIDDMGDYRPGLKALSELAVLSPLKDNQITKAEIREFSKQLNLDTWDKPAYACLYSRIPYGEEIKPEELERIGKSEKYLIGEGFKTVRVRCHGNLARIEVAPKDREAFLQEPFSSNVVSMLKSYGFKYVTLDVQGYKMGSFNEFILEKTLNEYKFAPKKQ